MVRNVFMMGCLIVRTNFMETVSWLTRLAFIRGRLRTGLSMDKDRINLRMD